MGLLIIVEALQDYILIMGVLSDLRYQTKKKKIHIECISTDLVFQLLQITWLSIHKVFNTANIRGNANLDTQRQKLIQGRLG